MLERNQKMKTNLFWDLVKNGLCAETTCDASLIRKAKNQTKRRTPRFGHSPTTPTTLTSHHTPRQQVERERERKLVRW